MTFLTIVLFILMGATALVMILGIFNLAKGGTEEQSRQGSNKLMMARVGLQAAAIMVFGLIIFLGN
jgi:hypothetical protein